MAPQEPSHSQETLAFQLVVEDGLAASAPDTVAITVVDVDVPPVCGLAQASPTTLWPPHHKLVSVVIVGVADPDNDQVVLAVTASRRMSRSMALGMAIRVQTQCSRETGSCYGRSALVPVMAGSIRCVSLLTTALAEDAQAMSLCAFLMIASQRPVSMMASSMIPRSAKRAHRGELDEHVSPRHFGLASRLDRGEA